jgi:hypothetical protein
MRGESGGSSVAAAHRRRRDVVPMAQGLDWGTNARDAGQAAAAAGGGGDAWPGLTILNSFSPVFFFSRVIKSGVSVGGARVGRGARRGVSRCEARTSGGPGARFQPCPASQPVPMMVCN